MQTCSCTNTYKYPDFGKSVCVICGANWPDDLEATYEEEEAAKQAYAKHLNIQKELVNTMWSRCSQPYREAWLTITTDT